VTGGPVDGNSSLGQLALEVADHVPAMLAYWNRYQVCVFANEAYRSWFGKSRSDVVGSTMQELLGPLYAANLPYIQRALAGETQVFERTIPQPGGGVRESLATYTPHVVAGVVHGFFVHVADVTPLKTLERQLELALHAVRTLRGLLPICMHCKKIRDSHGAWTVLETYLRDRTDADFTHGICPQCMETHYP
jgi:PAS domain S-box-containing protein